MSEKDIVVALWLNSEELNDLWSALAFFESSFPNRAGSVETRAAMVKLIKRIRKALKSLEPE